MPCDSIRAKNQTPEQREAEILASLRDLESALSSGTVQVVLSPEGAVAFVGEWNRRGVSDVCAYNRLMVASSFVLAEAIQTAETIAGRSVNPAAIAAGTHSHDGGRTWHPGH